MEVDYLKKCAQIGRLVPVFSKTLDEIQALNGVWSKDIHLNEASEKFDKLKVIPKSAEGIGPYIDDLTDALDSLTLFMNDTENELIKMNEKSQEDFARMTLKIAETQVEINKIAED